MQPKGGFDPNILGFDVSGPWLSVGIWSDVARASHLEALAKGQAERLMPLLEAQMRHADGRFEDLDQIAVGVGPGNFTGIRIAVSAARGLALALGIPAVGVSLFETLLDPDGPLSEPALILSLEAPRGQAYVQSFRYGRAVSAPQQIDPEQPPPELELPANMKVRGYRAQSIARPFHADWEDAVPQDIGLSVARIADLRGRQSQSGFARPAPLYIRPADAAPPRERAPVILP